MVSFSFTDLRRHSVPSQDIEQSPTEDYSSTHVDLNEPTLSDDKDGVPGVSGYGSAGAAQQDTKQTGFTDQDDEEEYYGRYIAAAMKKLRSSSRHEAKLKFQKILFSLQRLQEANERNDSPSED